MWQEHAPRFPRTPFYETKDGMVIETCPTQKSEVSKAEPSEPVRQPEAKTENTIRNTPWQKLFH